jgi:hypothetical protein
MLVTTPDLICDGQWHRLLLKRPYPAKPTALRVALESANSQAWLEVRRLEWMPSLEKAGAALTEDKEPAAQLDLMPLQLSFNDRFDRLLMRSLTERPNDAVVHDGGTWFAKDDVSVAGIPFRVVSKPEANNLIAPPPEPKENQEIIEHFGIQAPRGSVAKVSGDSRTTVAVNRDASEVFLLLAAEMPSREKGYHIRHCPTYLDNVEEFVVELTYDDGRHDFAFPYSIDDRGHFIRRALGAYVVPASGAKLKEVVLHNRKIGTRVHLAAVTVNTGKQRRFPALADETQPQMAKAKPLDSSIKPFARREGDLLKLGNALYELTLEESRGHAFMVRAYELKKRFKDCFASDAPEMLVPTERASIYVNRFPGKARTVWTVYNARPTTVRGAVLTVPHHEGATYRDEWNDKELQPDLRDGHAILSLELGPQSIGCISQTAPRPSTANTR